MLNSDYDSLQKGIKERYEKTCEDDEMNKQAVILTKTELYNCYKQGKIKRLDSQNSLESKLDLSE